MEYRIKPEETAKLDRYYKELSELKSVDVEETLMDNANEWYKEVIKHFSTHDVSPAMKKLIEDTCRDIAEQGASQCKEEAGEAGRKEREESEKDELITNLRNKAGNRSMESGHPVIDNTWSAFYHYFTGNGESAYIGEDTVDILLKHIDFTYKHKRIINGKTTSLSGNFSVDLRDDVFHIGYTNVDYVIECTSEICKVTYSLFVRDGFWDVDFIDEVVMGKWLGEKNFKPDGLGPNLERLGGTPYEYIPRIKTFKFKNPGY